MKKLQRRATQIISGLKKKRKTQKYWVYVAQRKSLKERRRWKYINVGAKMDRDGLFSWSTRDGLKRHPRGFYFIIKNKRLKNLGE